MALSKSLTACRLARKAQGFTAVKMNGTEDVGWLDSPSALDACIERVKTVRATGLDAGVDFHGRVHRPMAKQLATLLEPHRPMFIEEPVLSEHAEDLREVLAPFISVAFLIAFGTMHGS